MGSEDGGAWLDQSLRVRPFSSFSVQDNADRDDHLEQLGFYYPPSAKGYARDPSEI